MGHCSAVIGITSRNIAASLYSFLRRGLSFHAAVGTDRWATISLAALGHGPVAPAGICTSNAVIVKHRYPFIVSVDVFPSVTVIVPIYLSSGSISPSHIVPVWCVVGISNRSVISSVGTGVHITESY